MEVNSQTPPTGYALLESSNKTSCLALPPSRGRDKAGNGLVLTIMNIIYEVYFKEF